MRDITSGITFYHDFTTRAFATGIPTQLAGSPVLSCLEENNATPITAGVSVNVDRASVTGLNEATIVATGGNGFEAGKSYSIYISTGTVGGVSVVGEVVGQFTIGQSAAAVDAANATDGFGALKTLLDAVPTVTEFNARTGYAQNAIWIDTVNGVAGTTDYTHGIESNPVNSIANANTLAASLKINTFIVAPGSSITFAAAQSGQVFKGEGWTLALGGQNVANTIIIGATVSGIAAGTGVLQKFIKCVVNVTSIIKGTIFIECQIANTITVVEAGEFLFRDCASSVAGASAPTFDYGSALNSSNLSVRRHSGGWNIENMGAGTGTYNATFEGHGQIIWKASCSATSNASIRGHWKITDEASGAVTETKDDITVNAARLTAVRAAVLTDWINGGRLDLLLDAIPTTVMRGTDDAALASVWTVARAGALTDWINGGRLDLILDAILAMLDDARAEPAQGAPPVNPDSMTKLDWLYKAWRNKKDNDGSTTQLYNDDAATVDSKQTTSEAGGTVTKGEWGTGP